MTTWEYKVENADMAERWSSKRQAQELAQLQARINAPGDEGWELISYESVPMFTMSRTPFISLRT